MDGGRAVIPDELPGGGVLGRIDDRFVRASTWASRSIERHSRAEAIRAKELFRKHDPMRLTSVAGTAGGPISAAAATAATVLGAAGTGAYTDAGVGFQAR